KAGDALRPGAGRSLRPSRGAASKDKATRAATSPKPERPAPPAAPGAPIALPRSGSHGRGGAEFVALAAEACATAPATSSARPKPAGGPIAVWLASWDARVAVRMWAAGATRSGECEEPVTEGRGEAAGAAAAAGAAREAAGLAAAVADCCAVASGWETVAAALEAALVAC